VKRAELLRALGVWIVADWCEGEVTCISGLFVPLQEK
jgi:hypothetical protein